MNSFGAPFCRGIEPFLANLKALLDECARQGVSDFDAAVTGQAVYDDVNGFIAYVPLIGDDCARHTTEVQNAIARVTALLLTIPGANVSVPRPDAKPPTNPSGVPEIPDWIKFSVVGGLVLYGLSMISSFFPSRRRLAGRNRRRR